MRIWDVKPKDLCHKHLVAEHRELHGLWNILTKHKLKGGYSRHPETLRWVGKERALFQRHQALIREFKKRRYRHNSPLEERLAKGGSRQRLFLDTVEEQKKILKNKRCSCYAINSAV